MLLKAFLFAFGYGVAFYLFQFFCARAGMFIAPTAENIHSWDVGFYDSIKAGGYDANSDNTGFFILFPLVWKISHLGIWGITLLNTLFFSVGFSVLSYTLNVQDKKVWLLWLTLPPVYFAFIPYTESLFFLLGSLCLYGVDRKRYGMLWIALFLISLVRATGFFLIPAFIAMELLQEERRFWWKSLWRAGVRCILPTALGLGLFTYVQYRQTGIWFAYFKKQAEHWGHTFSLPGVPFSNIEGADWRYHWLSALAMFVNFIALIYLVRKGIAWLKQGKQVAAVRSLSAGYLVMVLMSLLFLNPKYGGHTTNIMGANRYTFITPFFFVFIHYLWQARPGGKQVLYIVLASNIFWGLFGAYAELNRYIVIGLPATFLVSVFLMSRWKEKYSWLLLPLIVFNFFMQAHFFQQFITPLYVD